MDWSNDMLVPKQEKNPEYIPGMACTAAKRVLLFWKVNESQ